MEKADNTAADQGAADPGDCQCKVGRTLAEYGLEELDETLATQWTAGDASLRELAEQLNKHVLRVALTRGEKRPLDADVESTYAVLVNDDVSSGEQTQKRRRLARDGVDIESAEAAFVSHQTVYNHLRNCLDIEKASNRDRRSDAEQVAHDSERIYTLQNRLVSITEDRLQSLSETGRIALGGFDVFVDVRVTCRECDRYHTVADLLKNRGCECQDGAVATSVDE